MSRDSADTASFPGALIRNRTLSFNSFGELTFPLPPPCVSSLKFNSDFLDNYPDAGGSRQWLVAKLVKFSLEAPESGATPQLLVVCLLKEIFKTGDVSVCGGDESVFGTNTTSKKPADIWLELNGSPSVLFEITLKKVDIKRLEDCIEAHRTPPASG